jgi:Tol biopolymer transport system component
VAKQTRRKRQEIPTTSLQLTYPALQVTVPHWSPDGKQIAFGGAKPGDPNGIYVIPAEGGSPEISSGKSDLDPTWSKDGSALMYGVLPVPANPEPTQMLLDLKTRAVTQVAASDGICCPRWSPDGLWVVALSADNQKLFLLDMSTQKWLHDLVAGQQICEFRHIVHGRSSIFSRVSVRWTSSASRD